MANSTATITPSPTMPGDMAGAAKQHPLDGIIKSIRRNRQISSEHQMDVLNILLDAMEIPQVESANVQPFANCVLTGTRGSGKSTFINQLMQQYVAEVGHAEARTDTPAWFNYKTSNGDTIRFLDTIGYKDGGSSTEEEDKKTNDDVTSKNCSLLARKEDIPNVFLFLISAENSSTNFRNDVEQLIKMQERVYELHKVFVPVIGLVTKCDVMYDPKLDLNPPEDLKPGQDKKREHKTLIINECVKCAEQLLKQKFKSNLLNVMPCVANIFFEVEENKDRPKLNEEKVRRNDKWNFETVVDFLVGKTPNDSTATYLARAQYKDVKERAVEEVTTCIATECKDLASKPLIHSTRIAALQANLVSIIGHIGGQPIDTETAQNFIRQLDCKTPMRRDIRRLFSVRLDITAFAERLHKRTIALSAAAKAFYIDGIDETDPKEIKHIRQIFEEK